MFLTRLVVTSLIAFALHWFLGWEWTVLAGILAGLMQGNKGWLLGFLAVGLEWAVLVLWNIWQSPESIKRLFQTMGEMMGGLPEAAFPVFTILIGAITGLLGGIIGGLIAAFFRSKAS